MNKVWTRCVVSIALALFVLQASAKEVFPGRNSYTRLVSSDRNR